MTWRPGSGWSRPVAVTPRGEGAWFDLAVGPGGRAVLAWQTMNRRLETGLKVRLMARTGTWRKSVILARLLSGASEPKVAMDARGVATVMYGQRSHLIAATRTPRGPWHRTVATAHGVGGPIDLAVSASGGAAALWEGYRGRLLPTPERGDAGSGGRSGSRPPASSPGNAFSATIKRGRHVMLPSGRAGPPLPQRPVQEIRPGRGRKVGPRLILRCPGCPPQGTDPGPGVTGPRQDGPRQARRVGAASIW